MGRYKEIYLIDRSRGARRAGAAEAPAPLHVQQLVRRGEAHGGQQVDHHPAGAISGRSHLDLASRWREIEAGWRRLVEVMGVIKTDRRVQHSMHAC